MTLPGMLVATVMASPVHGERLIHACSGRRVRSLPLRSAGRVSRAA